MTNGSRRTMGCGKISPAIGKLDHQPRSLTGGKMIAQGIGFTGKFMKK